MSLISVNLTVPSLDTSDTVQIVAAINVPALVMTEPAIAAAGHVSVASTGTTDLPAGTQLVDAETGKLTYTTTTDLSFTDAGTCDITVVANVPGTTSNLNSGTALILVLPNDDIVSIVVTSGITGGTDEQQVISGPAVSLIGYQGGYYTEQSDGTFAVQSIYNV